MVTRYNTGDPVLIPATIRSAEEVNGQIIYHVDADPWEGIPEDAIIINEDAASQNAMRAFMEEMSRAWR